MTRTILIYLASAGCALAHPGHLSSGVMVQEHLYQYEIIAVLALFGYAIALGYPAFRDSRTRKSD